MRRFRQGRSAIGLGINQVPRRGYPKSIRERRAERRYSITNLSPRGGLYHTVFGKN